MLAKVGPCHIVESLIVVYFVLLQLLFSPDLVLTSDVVITDEDGHKVPKVIGPLDEGTHLSLVCQTDGGNPSVVTWWKGSSLLDDSFVVMPQGVVRNELVLSRLHRNDLMTAFTCQAMVPNISQPAETSVSLDLNLKPLDVHITTLQRPLSAGREVTLRCQSSGSRPLAKLSWWKGSQQLLPAENKSSNGISVSILPFVPAMEDNGRVLSCRASNPAMNGNILEDHRVLNVYYIPQLMVTVGTPRPLIKEGDDVYFDCNIQANPSVTEVGWQFNGKAVYSNLPAGIKVNNQSLLLRHVTRKNSGNYTCIAANVEGEGVSDYVTLDVHYAPYCQPNQQISYGVPLQETVEVECNVDANPEDVSFQWYFNSSVAHIRIKSFIVNKTQSIASFTPRRQKDYGYLFCKAKNSVGIQKEPCCFRIAPAGPPDAVQNCEVTNETTSSVSITCEPGDSGGLPQDFSLELYSTRGLHAALTAQDTPIFHVANLPSGMSYIAVVFATNSRGRSNSVALTARTQPYPGPLADAERLLISPILAVLIAIVGALVLIAIGIVVGMRHHDTDGRDEQQPAENPHNPYAWEQAMSSGEIKPGQQYI